MAADNGRRSPSPPDSSGQASPAPASRVPRRHVEEDEPRRQDKTYRRYAAGIERALASFDTARLEWPDYISFLGRLLKAVQAHPPAVESLPHRFAVANRLAQCLRPSLPSGVHQKAIEVYSYIFSLIGKDNLALDLYVYLPGLSPVLTFASLSLRPFFLSLIETHILVLDGSALRPALKALILSLVPGLEDETSEDFDRTLQIVDNLKDAVDSSSRRDDDDSDASRDEYFWQCFFLASISSTSRRQGSLAFLNRRLPSLATNTPESDSDLPPAAEAVVSPEPGLLIRCLTAGLEDDTMLIQRGYLDLLLTHLPLHSPVLTKRVDPNDLVRLVGAATSVVTRRDMSLNRRLWAWFLGPEAADEVDEDGNVELSRPGGSSRAKAYFSRYGADPLVANLLDNLARNPSQPALRAKPFRMCLSLMDRLEIGGAVVPLVFLPAMENISRYQKASSDTDFQDALRSANSFFDGVESGTIWGQILKLSILPTDLVESSGAAWAQRLKLAEFIVDHFNVREEEMLFVHLPLVVLASLMSITLHLSKSQGQPTSHLNEDVIEDALLLVEKLIQLIPERAELNSSFAQQDADISESATEPYQAKVIKLVQHFYFESKGNLSASPPPLSSRNVAELLISESSKLLLLGRPIGQIPLSIRAQAGILSSVLAKLPIPDALDGNDIILPLQNAMFSSKTSLPRAIPFTNLNSIAHLLGTICSFQPGMDLSMREDIAGLITDIAEAVWDYLSPSFPKYHLEAVRCLWQLDDLLPDDCLIEALIAKCVGASRRRKDVDVVEPARKFSVLWTHTASHGVHTKRSKSFWSKSFLALDQVVVPENQDYQRRLRRPLFLLLEASDDTNSELQYFLRSWLEGLSNVDKIFEVLLDSIVDAQISLRVDGMIAEEAQKQTEHEDKRLDCLYYLQRLASLLDLASEQTWFTLCHPTENKSTEEENEHKNTTMLQSVAQICLQIVQSLIQTPQVVKSRIDSSLQRNALSLLRKILQSPDPSGLQDLKVEDSLIDFLRQSLRDNKDDFSSQVALLDALSASLKVRNLGMPSDNRVKVHRRHGSVDTIKTISRVSVNQESNEGSTTQEQIQRLPPPADLVKCLQEGLASSSSVNLLEKWIQFLIEVLPLFSNAIFQSLIPLVESFCRRISTIFEDLQRTFKGSIGNRESSPEPALSALLNGLECTLAVGHDQMALDEPKRAPPKSPEPQQGFFGNVVSGVFSSEVIKSRNSSANTRLTVILCFQDALKVCLSIWSWGGISQQGDQQDSSCLASFAYVSQRLRNKTRRILDRMFVAETLECLETIISIWVREDTLSDHRRSRSSISLLHVLEGSSPKHTIPSLFNAIYSRTTPASIDAKWVSTLTADLTDLEISQFLVEYTQSLDDDAMDEIWTGCMTFLRDVLANPLPHSHILPNLLLFIIILAEKMDKTNFGEQRKMRKEIGDLFLRLLTATFTTKSGGSHQEAGHSRSNSEKPVNGDTHRRRPTRRKPQYLDFVDTLTTVVPRLPAVLSDNDRLVTAVSNISANVISPLVHSKSFPTNLRAEYLALWLTLVKVSSAAKIWRKDISEAFLHPKLFSVEPSLALSGWAPLVYEWTSLDRDRIVDLCSRIAAPTSAGLMFGVGANAARLDADKKTQLNLRRIAFVIVAAEEDFAASTLSTLEEKITDLFNATSTSSPSSSTRAEVFMLLRAMILNTSLIHLSSLWPLITAELQRAISSALPRSNDFDTYNTPSLLQACKLLDLLLTISPDDFQVHEWLFITDTIDAVYRPGTWEPVALVDDVAEELGSGIPGIDSLPSPPEAPQITSPRLRQRTLSGASSKTDAESLAGGGFRAPLLAGDAAHDAVADMSKEAFIAKVLKPFFAQLSIHSYEATYSMQAPDVEGCKKALVADLFDDRTLVG